MGQTRLGTVLTSTGRPLNQCLIRDGQSHVYTDTNGEFLVKDDWQIGDTLKVSRIGYHPAIYILTQEQPVIVLSVRPVALPDVQSVGQSNTDSSLRFASIQPSQTAPGSQWGRWVESIPAVELRSYGGPAGVLTLSMDGGPATHLRLELDGFDLTNPQNGITDLSQLPLSLISTLSYSPVTSGSGSLTSDGVLKLQTKADATRARVSIGSYGHISETASLKVPIKNRDWVIRIGDRRDKGDFLVNYKGTEIHRQNNDFHQQFLQSSFREFHSSTLSTRLFGLVTRQKRGLAGLIYSPSRGRHNDDLAILGYERIRIVPNLVQKIQVQWQYNGDRYSDPDLLLHSRHRNQQVKFQWSRLHHTSNHHRIFHQFKLDEQRIVSTDAGRRSRLTGEWESHWNSDPEHLLRFGIAGSFLSSESYTPEILAAAESGVHFDKFATVRFIVGRDARIPTFNELYWTPGGNPNLKPEHTRYAQTVITSESGKVGQLNLMVFRKSSRDLIQWIPHGSIWQPVNIEKTERTGWKISWSRRFSHWKPAIQFSQVKALNKSPGEALGKQLPYVPLESGQCSLTWTFKHWELTYTARYRGKMISRYDWPNDITLPALNLRDFSVGKRLSLKKVSLAFGLNVNNLTNLSYETVQGYPEPGRTFQFTLTLQPNQED